MLDNLIQVKGMVTLPLVQCPGLDENEIVRSIMLRTKCNRSGPSLEALLLLDSDDKDDSEEKMIMMFLFQFPFPRPRPVYRRAC